MLWNVINIITNTYNWIIIISLINLFNSVSSEVVLMRQQNEALTNQFKSISSEKLSLDERNVKMV